MSVLLNSLIVQQGPCRLHSVAFCRRAGVLRVDSTEVSTKAVTSPSRQMPLGEAGTHRLSQTAGFSSGILF